MISKLNSCVGQALFIVTSFIPKLHNKVLLPHWYFFFEIPKLSHSNTSYLVCTNLLFKSSIELVCKKLQKLSSFFCNLIGFSKQAFKSDWLSYFSKTVSLTGKKMKFKAWNGVIKIIWMIANQTAKIINDFKRDVINAVNLCMWCCDYSF